ncbi:MAG: hypothetical protein GX944_02615 [Alphaproteobacteria bacterium]|nr:hypothetical protein [Alphaproteobacteria bacterium]
MNQMQNKIANNKYAFLVYMAKFAILFVFSISCLNPAISGTINRSNYINPVTYSNMQPFLNKKMREALQQNNVINSPDQTAAFSRRYNPNYSSNNQFNTRKVIPRQSNFAPVYQQGRRVVPRSGVTIARSGIAPLQYQSDINNTSQSYSTEPQNNQSRRVVMRSSRVNPSVSNRITAIPNSNITNSENSIGASRCLADYRACMDGYCKRQNTPYNRCYCSDELIEIETNLRPAVEDVLGQLFMIKNGGLPNSGITDSELEELWQNTFYQHTGTNDMVSLNEALNISWPDENDNVRGQTAFLIGHDYCIQHLRGCFYMISNLRDSYKSEISRDCTVYKTYLNKLKTAGESIIANFEN